VDLASALLWDLMKIASKYAPITYGSVASNHCQWRHHGQTVGRPGQDDSDQDKYKPVYDLTFHFC